MKNLVTGLVIGVVAAVLALGVVGPQLSQGAPGDKVQPTVVLSTPLVELNTKTSLVVMGSGFEPNVGLNVLLRDATGATSLISDALTPKPKIDASIETDKFGQFASLFSIGAFETVETEGVYSLTIVDTNYNVLATTPIGFADPNGRSGTAEYPKGAPDYVKNPKDPRPLPWTAPFFKYPAKPAAK